MYVYVCVYTYRLHTYASFLYMANPCNMIHTDCNMQIYGVSRNRMIRFNSIMIPNSFFNILYIFQMQMCFACNSCQVKQISLPSCAFDMIIPDPIWHLMKGQGPSTDSQSATKNSSLAIAVLNNIKQPVGSQLRLRVGHESPGEPAVVRLH